MNNDDIIPFRSDDIDQGVRSCFVCGQPITDLRKARELGDTTVLVHAGLCEKSLTDAPEVGPVPVLCSFCTHAVGSDAVKRTAGTHTVTLHPLCARYVDAQVHRLASDMVRQAPKPVTSNQAVRKTLSKSAQADDLGEITIGLDVLERTFGVKQTSKWWIDGTMRLAETD